MEVDQANQEHRTMSILNRTLIILIAYTIFLVCTIPFGVYYITNNLKKINQSTIDLNNLRIEVGIVNDYFIRQAKDRKNLFLRGHRDKDLEKYGNRVRQLTENIQEFTREVLKNPLAQPYREDLEGFLATHQQLMEVYDRGVEIFQSSQDHTQGDAYVRGMGAETGKELTDVIRRIQTRQTQGIVENQQKIQHTMLVTSSVMVVIILLFSGLDRGIGHFALMRPKKMSSEPR